MKTVIVALASLIVFIPVANAQKPPPFYGVYALHKGQLIKLDGKSTASLGGFAGASGIIQSPSMQRFPDGDLQFVVYRRDLASAAPDSIYVNIVAKVVLEKSISMNGAVTGEKPVTNTWTLRNFGYKFLVAPYEDNREMILVRHQNDNFQIPDGRYAITIGNEYYDFLVNKENTTDLDHCVEWHATMMGVSFPVCSSFPIVARPLAPVSLETIPNSFVSYFPESHPAIVSALQKVVPVNYKKISWIYNLQGTAGPGRSVVLNEKTYFGGFICKPHDCQDNQFAFLGLADGSRSVGIIRTRTAEGQQFKFERLGNPTPEETNALMFILNKND